MTKKEIEKAIANNQPLYWQEVKVGNNKWHQVQVVAYDAAKRRWRIETPVGIRFVRSSSLCPHVITFGNYTIS